MINKIFIEFYRLKELSFFFFFTSLNEFISLNCLNFFSSRTMLYLVTITIFMIVNFLFIIRKFRDFIGHEGWNVVIFFIMGYLVTFSKCYFLCNNLRSRKEKLSSLNVLAL